MSAPGTPTLQTRRFILRELRTEDAVALWPTLSDPEHCRYLTRPPFSTMADLMDWLIDPDWNGRTWIAEDRTDGAVAGRFILVPGHEPDVAEVGYITVKGRQGQHVALDCMTALITHAFEKEGHRRLVAEVDADNAASAALAERLGFTREGRLQEHDTTHKGLCDLLIYRLLRREWVAPS